MLNLILGGAAVHRCGNRPLGAPSLRGLLRKGGEPAERKSRPQSGIQKPTRRSTGSNYPHFPSEIQYLRYRTLRQSTQNCCREGSVTTRRLDDKIRELCNRARVPQSAHELQTIIIDLESALRERNRLRKSSALRLVGRAQFLFAHFAKRACPERS